MTEEIEETGDYPFKSWNTFFTAFNESLNTEFLEENYPKYQKILDKYTDYYIIRKMFDKYKLDANDGLYNYIYCLCHTGTRYATDIYDGNVINFFIKKGATFPTDLLFDRKEDCNDIEEECYSYDIRAYIIDSAIKNLKIDISEYTNWQDVETLSFDEQDINMEQSKTDEDYYDLIRFRHLKSLSEYLQKM